MNNWKSTDGYLLFDFSDVNPALTNQTVDGIYQRAKNLIANNKFVLLVNEGVHTPIPAVVAYVNQAYVIETVLYAYTITSNDNVKKTNHEYGAATLEDMTDVSLLNPTDGQYLGYDAETNYWVNKSIPPIPTKTSDLTNDSGFVTSAAIPTKTSDLTNDSGFITDADVPVIDDSTTSATKVWSSDKVSSELSGKADSSSIPTKTSQLTNDSGFITSADVPVIDDTAVVNNKVWSSYKTNSELLGKQNTLTAGSNISISGDTISATDTTYSEGDGIDITSGVISMDIDSLTEASSLAGTDLIAISDTDGHIKSTTVEAVAGLALAEIGEVKTGAWIANSSSAYNTNLTDSIAVTKGVWIVSVGYPFMSNDFSSQIDGITTNSDISDFGESLILGNSYTKISMIVKFSGNATLQLKAAGSSSVTCTYTERGYLKAVKVAP